MIGKIEVSYLTRRPQPGMISIEMLYGSLGEALADRFRFSWVENRFRSAGVFRRLYDALRAARFQSDVNHVLGDVHYLTFFLRKRKTILTIHDFVLVESSRGVRRFILLLFWYWIPLARVARVVVISEATRDQLLRYCRVRKEKVQIIHNPVREEFKRTSRKFDPSAVRFLQVGTGKNKNLERHALVVARVGGTLVVIGKLDREQKTHLTRLGIDVECHSGLSQDEVVRVYQGCDVLLFASLYEGFGLPIIEAQSVGIPVITANRFSMPEVAGSGALVVDPSSVEEIEGATRLLLTSREVRETLVENGLRNVVRFQMDFISAQYAELYEMIARESL